MKLIFVSGPYTAKTSGEIRTNIWLAEQVSLQLIKNGWAVFTPHKNTAGYERYEGTAGLTYQTWIDIDLEILSRCDALFMMQGSGNSRGAQIEYEYAKAHDIDVYFEADGIPHAV